LLVLRLLSDGGAVKKLDLSDIRPPRLYERVRDVARAQAIAHKRAAAGSRWREPDRRVRDRSTMIFQIEEMARAEHLDHPGQLQAEIDLYNGLLPDDGELSATLFVDIDDAAEIRPTLEKLSGWRTMWRSPLVGWRCGRASSGREEDGRISAVQYLKFALPPEARKLLAQSGTAISLSTDLPRYRTDRADRRDRASLAADLA